MLIIMRWKSRDQSNASLDEIGARTESKLKHKYEIIRQLSLM